ncbi:hypothetical protein CMV_014599 [Castanea mollissima]|uniref:DNA repair protein RAD51 homolog 3 n=1 Tax=Castanea mollissima TaxID=60419 RepID=A0A8J4VKV3_9ROSI|nr:hypothetical protein CMV_014599 [Castanea mollissima]
MSECGGLLRKDFQAFQLKMHPNNILENIFYFRVCSYTEQIALINYLDKFISEHKDVKIVIVDSVTFHFRQDFDDMALRTRLLSGMALKLMKLAKDFSLAVVLLNQVTTKYIDGSFQLTLALGDSWSHSCTNRVILYWNGNERYAYIDKSPSLRSASAPYSVTSKGEDEGGVFPTLRELRIINCPKLTGNLPSLLPSLSVIEIEDCPQLVASLPSPSALHELALTNCDKVALKELSPKLQSLGIGGCHVTLLEGGLPTTLKTLQINGVLQLPGSHYYPSIESLKVYRGPGSLWSLPLEFFPKLKSIDI